MFRQIGGNYYNDEKFEKIITTDGKNYVVFDGGNRLEIDDDDFQSIIENGWIRIGGTHYNPSLIAKIAEDRYGRKYAEFTNGEHMPLSDTEWQDIIDENGQGTGGGVTDIEIGDTVQDVTASDSGDTISVPVVTFEQLALAAEAEIAGQDARFVVPSAAGTVYYDLQTTVTETTYAVSFWMGNVFVAYTGTIADETIVASCWTALKKELPAVLTTAQSLTAEQQAQVLTNLGVIDAQDISY